MKKIEDEKLWGGILGTIAIIAAIISLVLGEINASSIAGCIKDIAGILVNVIVLFVAIKHLLPKKTGDFTSTFKEELETLYKKYNPIFFADSSDKGKTLYRHNIARKLDGIITGDAGNERDIRFFDFDYDKSTIEFFVQGKNFDNKTEKRTEHVAKDVFNKLESSLHEIAKITPKFSPQVSVKIEFKEPLIGSEDAKTVAKIIDDVIFYYITEYKK